MQPIAWIRLVVCFVIGYAPAMLGAAFRPGTWYDTLNKPEWNPPSSIFGPVWTLLYAMISVSLYVAWTEAKTRPHAPPPSFPFGRWNGWPFAAFAVQMVLNAAWSPLFFGLHRPDLALIDIIAMWLAIGVNIALFYRIRPLAAVLLLPYWAWVSFATGLNYELWVLNPQVYATP